MINLLIKPFLAFKVKYVPLLFIYVANSFVIFSQIAETFWIKNNLTLTQSEVISISIWANLPWSMKIILGQCLDSFKIFGSQRHSYIIIASLLMLFGNLLTIVIANNFIAISVFSTFELLIIAGIFINIGIVLQDLVADTLCYDVVDKFDNNKQPLPQNVINEEINNIQILVRIFDIGTKLFALAISGYIANNFIYKDISFFTPISSLISILGVIIVSKEPLIPTNKPNNKIIILGLSYIFIIAISLILNIPYKQEFIFIIGTVIICIALKNLMADLNTNVKKEVIAILIIFFAYRLTPNFGPGIEWWQIDELGFTPDFFALLQEIATILSLVGVFVLGEKILNMHIGKALLGLTIFKAILMLPDLLMSYNFHKWTEKNLGFGAKTIALIDNTIEGPFNSIYFLILCSVVTKYTPKNNMANWFAIIMTLMSLSFIGGSRIIKRYISDMFIIERGFYDNVSSAMIITIVLNLLIPTLAVIIFMNPFKNSKFPINSL